MLTKLLWETKTHVKSILFFFFFLFLKKKKKEVDIIIDL